MEEAYLKTVRLLLDAVPDVFAEPSFALKGGTAINLFVQDMPRLSIDIDVVFTDFVAPREKALGEIAKSLRSVRTRLEGRGFEVELPQGGEAEESKLFVRRDEALVKVEVNHVFRGTVMETTPRALAKRAGDWFAMAVEVPTLAVPELYGSKLVAAMDRQHPRDLFDVMGMYQRCGLNAEIVECFVCYLAGHNRPVHEVLFGRLQDISGTYHNEFLGMSRSAIELRDLLSVRARLWAELPAALSADQREFLAGLVRGEPDWGRMRCPHLNQLPAIRWKLRNLRNLQRNNPAKFADQARLLDKGFGHR